MPALMRFVNHHILLPLSSPRQACENTPTSRNCWGDFSIDTNYYDVVPDTGRTVEYWLSVQQGPCTPDGYQRTCMTFNGTVPGPTIIADWGDTLVIHVTNNMVNNGTAIHWHGLRQLSSFVNDGVPGATQCPIAPGQSLTYRFRVSQYGSTWYHSHFSLQYSEGLFGGMIFNGPATANYDEDLGTLFLQDWSHIETFALWDTAKLGAPPVLATGLVNGTNRWDCGQSPSDPRCTGTGVKFQTVFEAGKKYRLRLINVAVDGKFQFSIDGHSLTVMSTDLVPIVPYTADSVQITIGQRYDVVVEANAAPGNYWLRAGWVNTCSMNGSPGNITGIVRYDGASTADPTSTSSVVITSSCLDEPAASLVPHLAIDPTNIPNITLENLSFGFDTYFKWTVNTSSLLLDWANPTVEKILDGESIFPTEYNVVAVQPSSSAPEWAVLVIQDTSNIGLAHPIHLHGHDFWVLAQATGVFDGTTASFDTTNPPRRDVATLPGNGYLALAFLLDNPGAWLTHCHIAWHASQGLSLEFVESQSAIVVSPEDQAVVRATCSAWDAWEPTSMWEQDDSGI
ncbi:multicopper oxidase-domain-containing protein [Lasiosphaeria ovina]|uniref:Multicopper oxidase-domain-containing protein n=1 Tax=Lasiosphaeria ovina TaxID=92902 RepID=A0AAE0K6S8_9PEZI|nr:multicopper oxidase-domain-containing protein [Lasiosphaeria ovina]